MLRLRGRATIIAAVLGAALMSNELRPLFTTLDPESTRLRFKHQNGATGRKELIEIMGSGVALFDYDRDGKLDIYLVNGATVPGLRKPDARYLNRLYRNLGHFHFSDVTARSGLQGAGYGMGVATGDYDNDGFTDLYLTQFGRNQLFRNQGNGTFADVTDTAGIAGSGWSTSAAFLDYDRDGHLDLFVCRYLEYRPGVDPLCGDATRGLRSYCLPDLFPAASSLLFHNEGNGQFTDVSGRSGIGIVKGKALGVATADLDGDGWTDIFVSNDRTPNFLFRNKGDGTFEEIGLPSSVAYSVDGVARAGMGVDAADFDQDGLTDLIVTNFEAEGIALFRNGRFFQDESGTRGLFEPSYPFVGFGIKFVDYDNNGLLDVFAVNGHVLDDIARYRPNTTFAQPKLLFHNNGNRFHLVAKDGAAFSARRVGRGAAFGDLDNNGAMDVVVSNNGSTAELLRNVTGPLNNSVLLKLTGTKSNRDGIGAVLRVRCGTTFRVFHVTTAASYLSANDVRVHIGLGHLNAIDEAAIYWPSGKKEFVRNVATGYLHELREGAGIIRSERLCCKLREPDKGDIGLDRIAR